MKNSFRCGDERLALLVCRTCAACFVNAGGEVLIFADALNSSGNQALIAAISPFLCDAYSEWLLFSNNFIKQEFWVFHVDTLAEFDCSLADQWVVLIVDKDAFGAAGPYKGTIGAGIQQSYLMIAHL